MSLFENTLRQISKAADLMNLNDEMRLIMESPQRKIEVSVPVKMDDGSFKIFKGFRIQHNNYLGPFKGGIRYHQQVDESEVSALSAWMTIKCSVAGLPLGGGKGGIVVNPKELSEGELERMTRAYIRLIAPVIGPGKDVPAPDVNTNPKIMAWMADEYSKVVGHDVRGVVTGKPIEAGGSLGRGTATAQGGYYVLREVMKEMGKHPAETKVVIQGYGNAGSFMAKIVEAEGYKVVGVSDSQGAIYSDTPLSYEELSACKAENGSVTAMPGVQVMDNQTLLEQECDVLVLAALENQVHKDNAANIKASVVVELANGPTAPEADEILHERGVIVLPDILANSGGVTVSYYEMVQNEADNYWSEEEVDQKLEKSMVSAYQRIKENFKKYDCTLREAAYITAIDRIQNEGKRPE